MLRLVNLEHVPVAESLCKHAQCLDWEDVFVVWVGNHAALAIRQRFRCLRGRVEIWLTSFC